MTWGIASYSEPEDQEETTRHGQGRTTTEDKHRQEDKPQLVMGFSQLDLQTKGESFFLLPQNKVSQIKALPSKPAYGTVAVRKNLWYYS